MTESTIQKLVRLAAAKCGITVFRINSGQGWTGDVVHRHADGTVVIKNARPFRTGWPKGGTDIFGWLPITITPEMIGLQIAVATGIECKTERGRTSEAQANFIEQLCRAGGIGIIARGSVDVQRGVFRWLNRQL